MCGVNSKVHIFSCESGRGKDGGERDGEGGEERGRGGGRKERGN